MNPPTDQWSTTPLAEPAAPGRQVSPVIDTILIAREAFRSIEFRGAVEKRPYTENGAPVGPQKIDKPTGLPVWTVRVLVERERYGRVKEDLITVSVPFQVNPEEKFQRGNLVWLPGLTYGVTSKREGGGFSVWFSCDAIEPANVPKAS